MKEKWTYLCQNCGQQSAKWSGQCSQCGEWNSIAEERITKSSDTRSIVGSAPLPPQPIAEIATQDLRRITTGLAEWDNVLGGGLVPGSAVLLGGEPGIGKSTILLQAASCYAQANHKVLYVSGEESPSQIALRSNRLEVESNNLYVLSETNLDNIRSHLEKLKPQVLIIDSIQTVFSTELESQPGSVGQLRECAYQLISFAKETGTPTFFVGHVTKEGAIAGPKILEHMVDVVLYFEGTNSHSFRLLRAIKNRFGSTNEIGVFEMAEKGMREVTNPSESFLAERATQIPGSVIVASIEGTRPLLVEVQALVSHSPLAIPRRTAIGLDPNRVSLLVTILEKRAGFRLFDQDVYANVAGGLRILEPAVDLGLAAALVSSFTGKAVDADCVFFGEIGLGGEVRSVPRAEARLKEAKRIGFKKAFVPQSATQQTDESMPTLVPIEHVHQLSDFL